MLAALFDGMYIVRREQDGKFLAAADGRDGLFDTAHGALKFLRDTMKIHDLDWRKVSMDEATREQLEHPRH